MKSKKARKAEIFLKNLDFFDTLAPKNGILCNRKIKNRRFVRLGDIALPHEIHLHTPAVKHRRFYMNCCHQGNNVTLWILIALLVLGSKDGMFCSNVFSGCGLPIILALLFCLYKNGTLASILTPSCNCGCNCGC